MTVGRIMNGSPHDQHYGRVLLKIDIKRNFY